MKKTYIQPRANAICLFAEDALLTGSITFTSETKINAEDARSAARGWNSDDWSGVNDED